MPWCSQLVYEEGVGKRGECMRLNTHIAYLWLSSLRSLSHVLLYNPLDRRSGSMSQGVLHKEAKQSLIGGYILAHRKPSLRSNQQPSMNRVHIRVYLADKALGIEDAAMYE